MKFRGSYISCLIMEMINYSPSDEAKEAFDRALSLGAKLVFYVIEKETQKCIVCTDPCGNEFELNALSL